MSRPRPNSDFCHRCGAYIDRETCAGRSECLDCAAIEFLEWAERHPHAKTAEIDQRAAWYSLTPHQARRIFHLRL